MTESRRLIFAFSFLLIYGLSSLSQNGTFLLPLPLMEILFFILCIPLFVSRLEKNKVQGYLMLAASIFYPLMRSHSYSLLFDYETVQSLDQFYLFDLFQLLFFISLGLLFLKEHNPTPGSKEMNQIHLLTIGSIVSADVFEWAPLLWALPIYAIFKHGKKDALWREGNSFWACLLLIDMSTHINMWFLA